MDTLFTAEQKAIKEVENQSELGLGKFETQGQIIERIKEINESIRGFDLVVESETFRELAKITGVTLPRLNDRIIFVLTKLIQEDSKKMSTKELVTELLTIFNWDEELSDKVNKLGGDIESYLKNYSNKDKGWYKEIIRKHGYLNQKYKDYHGNPDLNPILKTNPFVKEIGYLLSLSHSIFFETGDKRSLNISVSLILFVLIALDLSSVTLLDILPTLLRAICRQENLYEIETLQLKSHEIKQYAEKSEVGKLLLEITKMIVNQDTKLNQLHSCSHLMVKFDYENVWDNIEYLPKLAILEELFEKPEQEIEQTPIKKRLRELIK